MRKIIVLALTIVALVAVAAVSSAGPRTVEPTCKKLPCGPGPIVPM